MSEHKVPKPALERPAMAILRVQMAVNASRSQPLTKEERDFFADQAEVLAWIAHLEKTKAEGAAK